MAELTIRPEEIRDALENFVQSYKPDAASREEVGTVTLAGDGIAKIEGLPSAMANELLKFEDGTLGLALNLEEREIGAIVLGEFSGVEEGQPVTRTGEVLSVAVGEATSAVLSTRSATRSTASARSRRPAAAPWSCRPHGHAAQVGARADGDRLQGRRRDDPDRPWSAPADHR